MSEETQISDLLDRAVTSGTEDQMMAVAEELLKLDSAKVADAMKKRADNDFSRQQIEKLRGCFLKLLT